MAGEWQPDGWTLVRLGDLGEVNRGRSRHRPRYAEHLYGGPYPFIQTGDIRESGGRITSHSQTYNDAGLAQSRLWPAGTMCITIAANIAETAVLTYPACFPDSVVGFVADDTKCIVEFVEYMFRFLRRQIQHEATGSVQDNINLATLDRLRFPLPPLKEQQAIACILGALDDKIELNRRMNQTLEATARAIFKSWFVDFDPVRWNMDRKKRERKDAKTPRRKGNRKLSASSRPGDFALNPDLAALFPDAFADSDLGPIPKGWRVGGVRDIVSLSRDAIVPSGFPEETFDYYSIPAFDNGQNPAHETGEAIRSQKFLVTDDCVLVSKLNPKTPRVWFPGAGGERRRIASTEFLICEPKPDGRIGGVYFYYLSCDAAFSRYLTGRATGTSNSHQRVRPDDFLSFQTPLASANLPGAFETQAKPILDRVLLLKRESSTLGVLRDALLPRLISGELAVPDAERIAGRAT